MVNDRQETRRILCLSAIGDLWIAIIVLRYASTAYVIDERDGVRVFLQNSEVR